MMKKVFGLLVCAAVVFVMVFAPVCAAEDATGLVYFDATLANFTGMNEVEWMEDYYSRAMLTVFMALDLAVELGTESVPLDLTQASYVGRDGNVLDIYFHGVAGFDYLVAYNPSTGSAAYQTLAESDDAIVRVVLRSACEEGYFENRTEDINELVDTIASGTAE